MIKAAIDRIEELAHHKIIELDGRNYSSKTMERIDPPEAEGPRPIFLSTLDGLVEYMSEEIDNTKTRGLFLIVNNPEAVSMHSHLMPEFGNRRHAYVEANLAHEGFKFGTWLDLEMFIISLQSQFIHTNIVNDLISHLGNLRNEKVVQNTDNKFSQSIQIKSGIMSASSVEIQNPMSLIPYRTFNEVDQPASNCIFRLREMPTGLQCALFVADGGAWKNEAMKNIATFLKEKIANTPVLY